MESASVGHRSGGKQRDRLLAYQRCRFSAAIGDEPGGLKQLDFSQRHPFHCWQSVLSNQSSFRRKNVLPAGLSVARFEEQATSCSYGFPCVSWNQLNQSAGEPTFLNDRSNKFLAASEISPTPFSIPPGFRSRAYRL